MATPTWGLVGTGVKGTGVLTPVPPTLTIGATPDIMYAVHVSGNQDPAPSPLQGFVEVENSPIFVGTAGSSNAARISTFVKRAATTGDPGPTFAACPGGAGALIFTIKGVAATAALWHKTAGNITSGATLAISIIGQETTLDECLVVNLVADHLDSGVNRVDTATWASTGLTSVTDRGFFRANAVGNGCGIAFCTGIKAVKGAYGPTTATAIAGSNLHQARFTLAIAAGVAGAVNASSMICAAECEPEIGLVPTPNHMHWGGAEDVPWVAQSAVARFGGKAFLVAPIDDISTRWRPTFGPTGVMRYHWRPDILPAVDTVLARFEVASGGNSPELRYIAATQELVGGVGGQITTPHPVVLGQFHEINLAADVGANPRTVKLKVGATDRGTASLAVAPSTLTRQAVGIIDTPVTCRTFLTGFRFGENAASYPYGPSHNFALRVGADGIHVFNLDGDFLYETGADVLVGVTTSWQQVASILATRIARGTASATEYLEWLMASGIVPATTVINAVEVVSTHQGEDALANEQWLKWISGASTLDVVAGYSFPGPGPYIHALHRVLDPTGVAFTSALLQAAKFRYGYSATGKGSIGSLVLEVDCTLTSPPVDSEEINASHTYAAAGTKTITLTVTDDQGLQDTTAQQVTV